MINRRIAVKAIIVHDGKLLVVRHKKYKDALPRASEYTAVPGGGVEPGEAITAVMERELIEELGIKPVVGKLLFVQQFSFADMEHIEFFFEIKNAADYLHVDLEKTTHGSTEIATIEFADPATIPNLYPLFLRTEKLEAREESPQFFSYL